MLRHFQESEFQGFWRKMDLDLLKKIDEFRDHWGFPIRVSPAPGAVGRKTGTGFHNHLKHGSVQAIDLFPSRFETPDDWRRAVDIATVIGFTGIGIYPKWRPQPGIHLDIGKRPGREPGNPATWSAFPTGPGGKQEYFALERAYEN